MVTKCHPSNGILSKTKKTDGWQITDSIVLSMNRSIVAK
ncbi:hypothetical protein GPAL_0123 [Glaciecola pallidula DSM 14239 = ACAM 615]|uniref:Uncharacterized protein n=1 Tax=Brumicola pallidula DSM 14239 = ACAM 615 TaxID=1121922 RepID=K6Y2E2_9ALTE|nr:hypothetical protein GPAL_0123 [Glaciecola pallidula DSM 14239 = ACAM 615]